jgi:hypothetical protein
VRKTRRVGNRALACTSARNHSEHDHIGEEKNTLGPAGTGKRARVDRYHASRYLEALGLKLRTPALLYRRTWGEQTLHGYRKTHAGWDDAEHPASLRTIHEALKGSFGVRVRLQPTVRMVVLDFDCHELRRRYVRPSSCQCVEGELCVCGSPEQQRRDSETDYRQRIADKVAPAVERFRQLLPSVESATFSSPRGLHVVMLLADAMTVPDAHELGQRILAALAPATAESFPKPEGDEGDGTTCRLPCSGRESRLLGPDLVALRHPTSRAADIEALLAMRRCVPSDFEGLPESTRVDSAPSPKKRQKRAPILVVCRDGESIEDAHLRAELASPLKGTEYAKALLAVYERGAPDDTSFDVMRKLAFLVTAAGLGKPDCLLVAKAFVGLGHHRATQMQTERGRKRLLGVFRACLRHQGKGVAKGTVTPGKLGNQALWAMIRELLGRRERLRVVSSVPLAELSAMKRKAARARWSAVAAVA